MQRTERILAHLYRTSFTRADLFAVLLIACGSAVIGMLVGSHL